VLSIADGKLLLIHFVLPSGTVYLWNMAFVWSKEVLKKEHTAVKTNGKCLTQQSQGDLPCNHMIHHTQQVIQQPTT
jgi:hypothetical protein